MPVPVEPFVFTLCIVYLLIGAFLTVPALRDLSRRYTGIRFRRTLAFYVVAALVLLSWPYICLKFYSQVD